jgi:hypothetical protein
MLLTSSRTYRERQQIRRTFYRSRLFRVGQPDRPIIIDATARECALMAKNGEFTPLRLTIRRFGPIRPAPKDDAHPFGVVVGT